MNRLLFGFVIVIGFALALAGCSENAPAAENANKAIQSMPAEQRFERIKAERGLSLPMKERAIENLPVSDDQKTKWKAEIRGTS